MKTIARKISLESLITRYPVCYPSIKDGVIHYLSSDDIDAVGNAHYGCIPLGINESITGSYSGFTEEMCESYSGLTISCYILQKWMNEFKRYYDLLRSDECHGEFENAVDYYSRTYPDAYTLDAAQELDDNFKKHGGSVFYKWLIDNYFIMLDLKGEYNAVSGLCSYIDWCEYIDNIGIGYMPFTAAVNFFGKLSRMHDLYSGLDCLNVDDCCDCVDFKRFGGNIMYDCIKQWLDRVCKNIDLNNENVSKLSDNEKKLLIPKTFINFMMTEKIEDLGILVSFSKEFIPGHTYWKGEICDYDDVTYIMVNEKIAYNKTYFVTEESGERYWEEYYDIYINEHENEKDVDYDKLSPLSGRTVSSLDFFMRKDDTVDGMGNVLPGYFRPNVNSLFVQPGENSLLGFMYQPGTYNNMEKLYVKNGIQYYLCDFLDKIEFFYRDLNGNIINETKTTAYSGDNVNEKIMDCNTEAKSLEDTKPNDGKLYADFYYHKDSVVTISPDGSNTYNITRVTDDDIDFIDHCTIECDVCQYCMSKTESYPLRYYKVNMDMETHFSDEYQRYVNVYMSDFIMKPSGFAGRRHNAKPFLRKEELLPFINSETPVDNIYIDRGYATVFDRHLRIGEITNYEQLEKYGNGIFQIFNADEDIV